jgi:hypothetical protein
LEKTDCPLRNPSGGVLSELEPFQSALISCLFLAIEHVDGQLSGQKGDSPSRVRIF